MRNLRIVQDPCLPWMIHGSSRNYKCIHRLPMADPLMIHGFYSKGSHRIVRTRNCFLGLRASWIPPQSGSKNVLFFSRKSRQNTHGEPPKIHTETWEIHTDAHGYTRENAHGRKLIHTGRIHTDTHGDSHTSAAKCARALKTHTDTHGDTHGNAVAKNCIRLEASAKINTHGVVRVYFF